MRCSVERFVSSRTKLVPKQILSLFFSRHIEITSIVVSDEENLMVEVTNKVTSISYFNNLSFKSIKIIVMPNRRSYT